MKKKKKILILLLFVCIVFLIAGFWNVLEVNTYVIEDPNFPKAAGEFCIVQISDFHCKKFGDKEEKLIDKVKECNPDVILFTGDMIDKDHTDISPVEELLAGLKGLCPMYEVNGNHDKDIEENYQKLLKLYETYGVVNLNDNSVYLEKNGEEIYFQGIDYYTLLKYANPVPDIENYKILLYHNAMVFGNDTSRYGADLVFSGHTHGGIVRLPFIGGLVNGDLTFGAVYENGVYMENGSILVSSRGLGDSKFPRFYNNSSVVKVILKHKEE